MRPGQPNPNLTPPLAAAQPALTGPRPAGRMGAGLEGIMSLPYYPEIGGPRGREPSLPVFCPTCSAPSIDVRSEWSAEYECGGRYEPKSQIQTHTDIWSGCCGSEVARRAYRMGQAYTVEKETKDKARTERLREWARAELSD